MVGKIPRPPRRRFGTRDRILASAQEVFAELGFSGARIDEIARRAKANKAMLYYHVGDKDELYQLVIRQLFDALQQELDRIEAEGEEPLQRLTRLYAHLVSRFSEEPAPARIMLREVLAGGTRLRPETAQALGRVLGFVGTAIDEGVAAGCFRRADPLLVHLGMMGLILLYFVSQPFRSRVLPALRPGIPVPGPEALARHVERALQAMLAPTPLAADGS